MVRFIVRRLLVILPMVLVVVSVTWGLIRLAPGNFYTGEKPLPPAIEKNIRERYGLDKPWYVQYGKTISSTLRGDFGLSLRYQGQPVNTILKQAVPVSAALGLTAYLLALAVGIVAGTYAALHQNTAARLRVDGDRDAGNFHSQLRARTDARAFVRIDLVCAAACALGRVRRVHDPAGADTVGHLHGVHRAAHPIGHARGAALELHPDGKGERTAGASDSRGATRCAADCCRSSRSRVRRWRCC